MICRCSCGLRDEDPRWRRFDFRQAAHQNVGMKLYFASNACSLSPHIALRESGLPFELERVDLKTKRTASGEDFLTVNPKGYVPALKLDDGQILTEGAVIVQWIGDQRPETGLIPPAGTMARYRVQEWLHYIATELHRGFAPLYGKLTPEEVKAAAREKLAMRFAFLAAAVDTQPYLMGQTFTVADGYAFYTLRVWKRIVRRELPSAALQPSFARILARPAVTAALDAERDS